MKRTMLITALALIGILGCAHADERHTVTPAAYGIHKVKFQVAIHLNSGTVSFSDSGWTNVGPQFLKTTCVIYPKKILRVKVSGGQVLLVIPDVSKSSSHELYFLIDDGGKIKELFSPSSGSIDEVWFNVLLFDLNRDGTNDFIIEWGDEGYFHIDAYEVTSDPSDPVVKIFSSPDFDSPQVPGIDDTSIKKGRFFIHYNYRGKEKTAVVRVNKDDPMRQPYIYPLGVTKR